MRQTSKQYRLHRRNSVQTVVQYVNHNSNVLADLPNYPHTMQIDMGNEPLPDELHIVTRQKITNCIIPRNRTALIRAGSRVTEAT